MKTSSAILFSAALASAASLEPRQLAGLTGGLSSILGEVPLADKTDLKATLRPGAKRHKVRFGPLELKGQTGAKSKGFSGSMDPNGQGFVKFAKGFCPDDCTILAGQATLEYKDGKRASPDTGVYVHHQLGFDVTKQGYEPISRCAVKEVNAKSLGSGKAKMGTGFLGSSEDNADLRTFYTPEKGTTVSGLHFPKGDRVMVQADLVNYSKENKQVYLTYDVEYLDGIQGLDTASTLLSVSGCGLGKPAINKNGGRAVSKSDKFPILVDGTILAAKGHLHNGGDKMVLFHNDKNVCESIAEYEGDQIKSMTQCNEPIKVARGDYLVMESVYDTAKHPLRKAVDGDHTAHGMGGDDVMGMWTMTVAVDGSAKGAVAAPKAAVPKAVTAAPKTAAKAVAAPKAALAL